MASLVLELQTTYTIQASGAEMNTIPTRLALEVIRDGQGQWDTRTIDLELGRRGAHIESGIMEDLRALERRSLIEESSQGSGGTGPRWRLTASGERWLESYERGSTPPSTAMPD
jgi:hypothetical protein